MTSTFEDTVDGVSTSTAVKAPCRVATTANITLSGTQAIDGVSVSADDRVLVKDQTTGTENGIYVVSGSSWSRAADFDGARDASKGTLVAVQQGTINADSVWRQTTAGTANDAGNLDIGTDSPAFELAEVFTGNSGVFRYAFDDSVSMADPGSGGIRLNNATLSSVTAIAISDNTNDSGAPDISDYIATWDDITSGTRGTIILKKLGAPENFAIYDLTAALTDNTGWFQGTVSHSASGGSFSDDDKLAVSFTPAGDGSVSVPSSSTDNAFPRFDGTGGASLQNGQTTEDDNGNVTVAGQIKEPAYIDVASATTTDLGAQNGRYIRITGTTTITGLGTVAAGTVRKVRFADALTLTHNGTSLILPGSANITTAANDTAEFISLGSGNWLCTDYQKADGTPVVAGVSETTGTWTPVLTFATAGDLSVAYTTQSGRYIKIGNMVTVTFNITTSSFTHSTASGNLTVTGLPFTVGQTSGDQWYGEIGWGGITKTNYTDLATRADQGGTQLIFTASGSGQSFTSVQSGDVPSGGSVILRGTITYEVDS